MELYSDRQAKMLQVDLTKLPMAMDIEVDIDLGENSNANKRDKLLMVATQLLPLLKEGGQGMVLKPDAVANIAYDLLHSLDLKPEDYLRDHTTEEFLKEVEEANKKAQEEEQRAKELAMRVEEANAKQQEANALYTRVQADNSVQDNVRQTAVAMDKHEQEWTKLVIDSAKAEVDPAEAVKKPNMDSILMKANETVMNLSLIHISEPTRPY